MSVHNVLKKGIYFCGSIRAGRQDVDLYSTIIEKLSSFGEVLTPFVGDKSITAADSEHEGDDKGIHDRDVQLLEQASGKCFKSIYSNIYIYIYIICNLFSYESLYNY